jgi:hypothetical protein
MLNDSFLAGFRAGMKGRPSGAYDAALKAPKVSNDDAAAPEELRVKIEAAIHAGDLALVMQLVDNLTRMAGAASEAEDDEEEMAKFRASDEYRKGFDDFMAAKRQAQDLPPPFPGRPTPGGEPLPPKAQALDEAAGRRARAASTYARNFPGAARFSVQPASAPRRALATDAAGYDQRFPEARRLRG